MQATLPGLEYSAAGGDLVAAAQRTLDELQAAGVLMPWHQLDCELLLETARSVAGARGIAKAQMINQLAQIRAKLPEPVIEEASDRVQTELERIADYVAHLEADDPADVPHAAEPAPVD